MHKTGPAAPRAANALLVGGGATDAERLAALIAADAQVICFSPDRATGNAVRDAIRSRVPEARVAVMLGDPALLVHKVSGPFDVIVDAHRDRAPRSDRLRALLADGGEFYG